MTGRAITDAQLAVALRVHLPVHAQPGLHDRIMAEIVVTEQQRRLPALLGRVTSVDPTSRRQLILLVALLALAASITVGVLVGAFLLRERVPQLSLDPPSNVNAFVAAAYLRQRELPAMQVTYQISRGDDTFSLETFYHDGNGTVRHESSGETWLYMPDSDLRRTMVVDRVRWVDEGRAGIDPKARIGMWLGAFDPDPDCPRTWRFVAVDFVLGRPAHHVACDDGIDAQVHLWIDIETQIVLRTEIPQLDQNASGMPIALGAASFEAVVLEFEPQPAELFEPDLEVMSHAEYQALVCATCPRESPPASPEPLVTPPPAPNQGDIPADLDAFIDSVHAAFDDLPPLELWLESPALSPGSSARRMRWLHDGSGDYRIEFYFDPPTDTSSHATIANGGREYTLETDENGKQYWRVAGLATRPGPFRLGLERTCPMGWEHRGFDIVLDRPAHHLVCGYREYWIDERWGLVVRAQTNPDPLQHDTVLTLVTDVRFGEQPPELFIPEPLAPAPSPTP